MHYFAVIILKRNMNMLSSQPSKDKTQLCNSSTRKICLVIRAEHMNGSLFSRRVLLIFEKQRQQLNMIMFIHDFFQHSVLAVMTDMLLHGEHFLIIYDNKNSCNFNLPNTI